MKISQIQKKTLQSVLMAAMVLGVSSVAEAKIVVEGEREFRDEVNDCLITYGNTPGLLGEVIEELRNSDFEHKIENSPDWTNTANDPDEATGGKGSGSVIRVDSKELLKYTKTVESLKNKDFCTALLHELWHAVDADRGEWSPESDTVDGVNRDEVEAVLFQNLIHAIRGVDPRLTYGGLDIEKHVVFGDDLDVVNEEEEEAPPEEKSVEAEAKISFAHVKPGEYSEVYVTVTTAPGATVDITLTGPGVSDAPDQSKTADADGKVSFTWKIVSYGTYAANGTSAGTPFTASVSVQ